MYHLYLHRVYLPFESPLRKPSTGLEPATCALQKHGSTIELRWQLPRLDSNQEEEVQSLLCYRYITGQTERRSYLCSAFRILNPRIYRLAAAANGVVGRTNESDALHEVTGLTVTVRVRNDTPVAVTLNGLLDVADGGAEVLNTEQATSLGGGKTTTTVEIVENAILLSNSSCHNKPFNRHSS